jgi:hypothetical protein
VITMSLSDRRCIRAFPNTHYPTAHQTPVATPMSCPSRLSLRWPRSLIRRFLRYRLWHRPVGWDQEFHPHSVQAIQVVQVCLSTGIVFLDIPLTSLCQVVVGAPWVQRLPPIIHRLLHNSTNRCQHLQ